jgi:ribosomal protection tetracycline resistance protein
VKHLNIGILAHVDAGKTSLTEQLLHHAGVIDHVGRVDTGDTQTDSLETERRRGITIRSAVVSFVVGDTRINLIDTPGHPDFISEVERALRVLDGVVLVVSAFEGVQAQTRVLMRALARQRIPVVMFANKIDRAGARYTGLLDELTSRLGVACVPVSEVTAIGTSSACSKPVFSLAADVLAEHSDEFLAAYLDDSLTAQDCHAELVAQTRRGVVSPVFFGLARTGDGVAELAAALPEFLGAATVSDTSLRAEVFKIERGRAHEKIAYVRVFSGSVGARDHVLVNGEIDAKVTAVRVFSHGVDTVEDRAVAGQIAKVTGLKDVRIGDHLGVPRPSGIAHFPPPGLETVVRPVRPGDGPALFAALQELAEQDPLITVRQDDETRRITVRLYGEVQEEVLQEMLGIDVSFSPTQIVCAERPVGPGSSVWMIGEGRNPYPATLGLRVSRGSGFGLEVEFGSLPLSFFKAIEESVESALGRGIFGWEVVDCAVTVTHTGYSSPVTTAGDFRKITPLVLAEALREAGTEVLEPVSRFDLELPADAVPATLSRLVELGALVTESVIRGERAELGGTLPTGHVHRFEQQLPGLSRGEGLLSTSLSGFQPIHKASDIAV